MDPTLHRALQQELDESRPDSVAAAATALAAISRNVYAASVHAGSTMALRRCADYRTVHVAPLVALIDANLRSHYEATQGCHWQRLKEQEMRTPGLVYILYVCDDVTVAFVSFMATYGDDTKVLYLFEIHVDPAFQHCGLGSRLLRDFHAVAQATNATTAAPVVRCAATMLTVFTENSRALGWYRRQGYQLADESPTDRVLRRKTVLPDYYILKRPL